MSYVTITITADKVESDLTDFLLLINLEDMPTEFWSGVASDGSDCFITDTSDTLVNYFLVDFDSVNSTGYIYTKVSLSSTVDNVFRVQYGSAVSDQQNTAVTLSNYAAYFVSKADGNLYELITGTSWTDGSTTTVVSENMGLHPQTGYPFVNGRTIESTSSAVYLSNAIAVNTNFTLAVTAKPSVLGSRNRSLIQYLSSWGATPSRYGIVILNTKGYPIVSWNPADNDLVSSSHNTIAGAVVRTHLTTQSGVQRILYTQGVQSGIDTTVAATSTGLDTVGLAAEDASLNETFSGNLAHAYIRSEELSASFIAAEYSNMTDPSVFIGIVGSEPPLSGNARRVINITYSYEE